MSILIIFQCFLAQNAWLCDMCVTRDRQSLDRFEKGQTFGFANFSAICNCNCHQAAALISVEPYYNNAKVIQNINIIYIILFSYYYMHNAWKILLNTFLDPTTNKYFRITAKLALYVHIMICVRFLPVLHIFCGLLA